MKAVMQPVRQYFMDLQDAICADLEKADGKATFSREEIPGDGGALARPRVMDDGPRIERAAVQFTHSIGARLPPAATKRHPELKGRGFQAAAISMIIHPRNPYVPTMHANLRFFLVEGARWYFGGGFDLTPYYPFAGDVRAWHQQARDCCRDFGGDPLYLELKKTCDGYFYLPHRGETRGVGGLFFDDWDREGFEQSFAFIRSVGDGIMPAYLPIFRRRCETAYGDREREFQLYRRGAVR